MSVVGDPDLGQINTAEINITSVAYGFRLRSFETEDIITDTTHDIEEDRLHASRTAMSRLEAKIKETRLFRR